VEGAELNLVDKLLDENKVAICIHLDEGASVLDQSLIPKKPIELLKK
jgi:hypothetical protein